MTAETRASAAMSSSLSQSCLPGGVVPEKLEKSVPPFPVPLTGPAATFVSLLRYPSEIFQTCASMNVSALPLYLYTVGTIRTTAFGNLRLPCNNMS